MINDKEKERIERCVVQIECIHKFNDKDVEFGTGFFIEKNIVVTASHVINKYYTNPLDYFINVIPINADIDKDIKVKGVMQNKENNFIAILELEEKVEKIKPLKFTIGYTIKRDDDYFTFGYPRGKRMVGYQVQNKIATTINDNQSRKADWDLNLSGERLDDFEGVSGSPVIIDNMLIGVVQTESAANGKSISISMSSVDKIKKYIPEEYCKEYYDMQIKWKVGFDYRNLNDVEFEDLCKDIMERKLNIKLIGSRKSIDGGICLDDNNAENNIIVQVKHHINNKFSDLKSSLNKEVDKIYELKPKQYYICCAQELNSQCTTEVYELFKTYMKTKENIITLNEIDVFLQEDRNIDIVRKHFKLWLYASNILSKINNQEMFIDCESLLADIEEKSKYYVQINTYYKCIDLIDKMNILMIIGAPGVGKTTISKMIILYYASLGYRVRYTTNGVISGLNKAVSSDRDVKEIILLDDCLGQNYFNLKENQECELIALINNIKNNNKKKLILNSRVTIINEAKDRSIDFDKFILKNNEKIHLINMDNINNFERAMILYNHIYFNKMPKIYYANIRKYKNYHSIVNHCNYNPRIVEYITEYENYKDIDPEKYIDFIVKHLDNPEGIWKHEYERRLLPVDRILINTLFSITDTTIECSVLEECYNARLNIENGIDRTIYNFDNTLNRLNKSMVKIIDINDRMEVSVLNPSVNDFIKNIFFKNINELENVKKSIVYYEQLERCYSENEVQDVIKGKVRDNTFINLKVKDINICVNIETLLLHYICEFKILNSTYIYLIKDYILKLEDERWIKNSRINKFKIVYSFFEEPFFLFYGIDRHIRSLGFLKSLLVDIELKDLDKMYNKLNACADGKWLEKVEMIIFEDSTEKINDYLENITIEQFVDDIEFWDYFDSHNDIIKGLSNEDNERMDIAIIKTEEEIYDDFTKYVKDDLGSSVNKIDSAQIKSYIWRFFNSINFEDYTWKHDIDSYVEGMLEPNYDEGEDYSSHEEDNMLSGEYHSDFMNTVDEIFDRDNYGDFS